MLFVIVLSQQFVMIMLSVVSLCFVVAFVRAMLIVVFMLSVIMPRSGICNSYTEGCFFLSVIMLSSGICNSYAECFFS